MGPSLVTSIEEIRDIEVSAWDNRQRLRDVRLQFSLHGDLNTLVSGLDSGQVSTYPK